MPPSLPASGPALESEAGIWKKRTLWLLLGAAVLRLVYAALVRIELAGDEAYYWDWGRRLDWGYYSKPPLIAWLMALIGWIGRNTDVAIRMAPVVVITGSLWLLSRLTSRLFGERAGFVASLTAMAFPANALLGFFFTIDAPLIFFWTGSLITFWDWTEGRHPVRSLLLLTLMLGLGHLSKQMMLIFPILAVIYLATTPAKRFLLRRPGFWLAVAGSLLFLVPSLVWNAHHDWITFQHTRHHFDAATVPFWQSFLEFLAYQLGAVLSPLLWLLVMAIAALGTWRWKQLDDRERFLWCFSAPALLLMYVMALRQTMLPNWAAVYYVAPCVWIGGWYAGKSNVLAAPGWRALWKPGISVGLVLMLSFFLLLPGIAWVGKAGDKQLDPASRVRGWREVGRQAGEFLAQVPRPEQTVVIALGHRYNASELAFYMPGQPRVYRWHRFLEVESQYELWPDPVAEGKKGWDALIFLDGRDTKLMYRFETKFADLKRLGEIEVKPGPQMERYYQVFLGRLTSWPKGAPPKQPGALPEEEDAPGTDTDPLPPTPATAPPP
ncbi:MAG: ArnT family glycosyltransferase [Verrucomicrobiales bacterium]|nr:glycosyltransferase family 39 protein [Verrucomicrobiae bacterium]MCP5554037.1 glycosyltransferase family 39 protein [Akkermansiaceae bacterium]